MSKLSFRWYGPDDPVPLSYIRQIPNMHSVVSAVYDVPPGEVWSDESDRGHRPGARDNGLVFDVVESIPVHEDIKLGRGGCARYIETTRKTSAAWRATGSSACATTSCRSSTGRARSWTRPRRTAARAL